MKEDIPNERLVEDNADNIDGEEAAMEMDEDPQDIYVEERWRWVNLTVFLLASLANCIPTHTFTPINSTVTRVYDVSKTLVGLNTLVFPISHPLLAFLANWVLDRYGLRIGNCTGAFLILVGVWFRCFIQSSFSFVLIGSIFASIGNIFIINSPSKLANVWFKPSMVAVITSLGVLCNLASNGIGVVLPSLYVDQNSTREEIRDLLVFEAILTSIPMILVLILMKKKPNNAPSFSAGVQRTQGYLEDLKTLFSNKNYLLLLLVCSMSYGTLVSFTSIIEYIVLPFRFSQPGLVSSSMLAASMGFGFVGCVVFIGVLKRTRQYRKVLLITIICTIVEVCCALLALDTRVKWIVTITMGFTGVFFIPQIPIILDLGCQLAFPIGQASSSGFLLAGGQLLGFITGLGFLNILDGEYVWKVYLVMGFFIIFLLVAAITLLFIKIDLRRTKYEHNVSFSVRNTLRTSTDKIAQKQH